MNVHLTLRSDNAKTGHIPVSVTSADSCPSACPLQGNGCYAEQGPLGMHWRAVSNGTNKNVLTWKQFCERIAALPAGQLWRHNSAGDLPGSNNMIDSKLMSQLVHANIGRRGFTYTHYPVLNNGNNRACVRDANMHGFTVNLSANNLEQADQLMALKIAPVVTLLPVDAPKKQCTPAGHVVVVCPAQYKDEVTCASCQLCQRANRTTIVGFRAHGPKRIAEKVFYMKEVK